MPTGFAYYADTPARWVLAVVVLFLFVFPWRGDATSRGALATALRAWVATLGALVATLGPLALWLFGRPKPLEGWWLHGAGWTLTALAHVALAIADGHKARMGTAQGGYQGWKEGLAMGALIGAPLVWLLKNGWTREGWLAVMLGVLVGAPLMVGGAVVRRALAHGESLGATRALWWGAVTLTLALPVAEALGRFL